ncbi:MAG TPA: hypothetical protein VGR10_00095 [Thermoleophilaceae bacterium]|nr:hypothetical protein [Thermoleophilaceae bacterium]
MPVGGFWISLAGGVALAHAGERLGSRRGYGASLAAMLQSVAMIGPARLGIPLTQALTAPLLGYMDGGGRGVPAQVLACAAVRTVQNALGVAFFIFVVTGLDAYASSYDAVLPGFLSLPLPRGTAAALLLTAAALLAWSAFGSTVQVLVYRRGLARWRGEPEGYPPPRGAQPTAAPVPSPEASRPRRFDARAVTVAAAVAFAVLLVETSWVLIAAAAAWLAAATLAAARPERDVVRSGLALAAVLALGGLLFSVVGGLGLDVGLRRGARAGLLVLVATWLRAAAGPEGLREVVRRTLRRLRRIPSLDEACAVLEELGATMRLTASGRALFGSLGSVRKRPLPVLEAVLGWVRSEAGRFRPEQSSAQASLGLRPSDAVLVATAAATALALVVPA